MSQFQFPDSSQGSDTTQSQDLGQDFGQPQGTNNGLNKLGRRRKFLSRFRPAIVIVLVVLLVGIISGSLLVNRMITGGKAISTPISQAQTAPKHPISASTGKALPTQTASVAHWITMQTFTSSGSKKTPIFTVPAAWRVTWNCNIISHNNTNYDVIIHPNTERSAILSNSVETVCSKRNTHGFIELHKGGKVYLSILSEGSWVVLIQKIVK